MFNLSIDINGIGIVSAKYKVINELFTKKRVLNFSIISRGWIKFSNIHFGNLKLFILSFAPIL